MYTGCSEYIGDMNHLLSSSCLFADIDSFNIIPCALQLSPSAWTYGLLWAISVCYWIAGCFDAYRLFNLMKRRSENLAVCVFSPVILVQFLLHQTPPFTWLLRGYHFPLTAQRDLLQPSRTYSALGSKAVPHHSSKQHWNKCPFM